MDDMDSIMDTQGIKLYKGLNELWEKAVIQIHKWLSNSVKVLENILLQYRASQMNSNEEVQTLGVWWLVMDDVFTIKQHNVEEFQVVNQEKLLE